MSSVSSCSNAYSGSYLILNVKLFVCGALNVKMITNTVNIIIG